MKAESSKLGQSSKSAKRPAEDEVIDFFAISSPLKRPHTSGSSSRRTIEEPIVIDDDDDGDEEEDYDEEAAYYEAQYGMIKKMEMRESRPIKVVAGETDQLEERDVVQGKLAKLDSEVGPCLIVYLPPSLPYPDDDGLGYDREDKLMFQMNDVRAEIEPLQTLLHTLQSERDQLESRLAVLHRQPVVAKKPQIQTGPSRSAIDYQTNSFPWSDAVIPRAKFIFDIPAFRLCQAGVINAAMDGRDIVCVMPTGGGKSLTYQLPAVMGEKGMTVVVSPLLALIWDQVRALKEIGVEAAMLTGSTSKDEQNRIFQKMERGGGSGEKELRLVYLTPEKVSKSKRLMSVLEKANSGKRLRRFVIDEAHCCSQLGHDFRPDYKQLSALKAHFPNVPIQAVTATLSSKTLPDLLKILRLGPLTDGRSAKPTGTVYFTAPLYRPNLHYRVMQKPSSAKATIEVMGEWILNHHAAESGIIYCLSKKDTETVADALREWSNSDIKTGVYHAGISEEEKEQIHLDWRAGKIDCICATTAFGLGIDKGNVRYVIHHSMAKSLDGYYQETGRAGRDGQDSDCVLFYRGQDATKLAGHVCNDPDGTGKLREMLRFAQDLQTCRKVAFAKYFSASANLSANAWDNAAALDSSTSAGSLTTCGSCDNCTRDEANVETRDVTLEAWKLLRVSGEVLNQGGRLTVSALAKLARGGGGGSFSVAEGKGKKKKATGEGNVDLEELVGGKVTLNEDDTERLIIELLLSDHFMETYSSTAYTTNTYVAPGPNALRLSRLTAERIEEGMGTRIQRSFLRVEKKARKVGEGKKKGEGKKGGEKKKRSRKEVVNIAADEGIEDVDEEEDEQYGEFEDDQ